MQYRIICERRFGYSVEINTGLSDQPRWRYLEGSVSFTKWGAARVLRRYCKELEAPNPRVVWTGNCPC